MVNVKKLLNKIINNLVPDSFMVVTSVSLTASGSIDAGKTCDMKTTSIAASIPAGYKMLYATLRGTSNHNAFCWYFEFNNTLNEIYYRIHNASTSTMSSATPTATLLLVKVGGVIRKVKKAINGSLLFERGWAVC